MKRTIPIIAWLFVLSCSGTNFNDSLINGNKKGSNNHSSQPSSTEVTDIPRTIDSIVKPPVEPVGTPVYPMPPGTAVIPVAIGGASLTCIRDEAHGMMCLGDESGVSQAFAPTAALYATEVEKMWIPTKFWKKAEGKFAVELPEALKKTDIGVSIMLVDAENRYMAAITPDLIQDLTNLVQDASFESMHFDPLAAAETRLVLPDQQTFWKARRPLSANWGDEPDYENDECIALIELESDVIRPNFRAAEGNRWMELSSRCSTNPGAPRKNLGIAQEIQLVPQATYYISFAYRAPAGEFTEHKLLVSIGGEAVLSVTVANPEWAYTSFLYTPEEGATTLSFDEFSLNPGRGTNIDNVQIVNVSSALKK